ncbi:hypothetical protein C7H62_0089 [Mesoflavibacter sp. HG96]|uniref:DUF5777 family beta-barrel protein n=1 Tax=Mesoflavibacter profundi TaxID=2708110 RepID=A0ABT4RYT9_9FLAO|nr:MULTISPECIES: DUF5777 family beta-barrel protein [Mesoflavibacter]MDA0176984.1 DUF5777 family beta-barrel protein [Mesoflavibacter profundi]QIJ87899.1 hypothetical protein C7H62_0089 [Mesoflavibacter sp. HG96]QIJ90627.1 hypothetical protein C7H56_0089 [Mesoflavibacter sp. HG37]
MKKIFLLLFCLPIFCFSQDDLLEEIDSDEDNNYATATFKGLKIVNFESTKLVAKKEFTFVVAHRFGSLENGLETFFGLDDAVTRLNFIYGINDAINISVSRSSFQKIYESAIKYRLTRQSDNFPFTIVGYNSILVNTALDKNNYPKLEFNDRLGYTTQVLIARKVSDKLSLELAPTVFHDNFVLDNNQDNTQYALGMGTRYKLGKRWSLNADYGWHLNRSSTSPFKNPLSIGIDLETGGHVFQMHFTNSQAMNTNGFLGQATGEWSDGDIYFGFNLSRRF